MGVRHGNTHSTPLNSLDVVLTMALTLKFHGTAQALRDTARRIRPRAPYEHRPKLKALAALPNDSRVLACAWQLLDNTRELLGCEAPVPPRCHMKPMRFGGNYWYCGHCGHMKERVL